MTSDPASYALGFGIRKMPAADPEVHMAAKELVRDPEAYFEGRREADLRQVRATLDRRTAKLADELASQDRERRRQRLRRIFSWLTRKA